MGGKKCGEQGGVESRLCPSFANSACFNAETEMKIEGQSSYFSYAGCSSFQPQGRFEKIKLKLNNWHV